MSRGDPDGGSVAVRKNRGEMSKRAAEYAHLVGESTDSHAQDGHRATPGVAGDGRRDALGGHRTLDGDSAVAVPGTAPPAIPVCNSLNAPRPRWLHRYQLTLLLVDMCAAFAATVTGAAARHGTLPRLTAHAGAWLTLLVIPLAWVCLLAVGRAYEAKALGSGPTEFERVLRAFFHLTAVTAFVVCAGRVPFSRHLVLLVLPLILVLSVLGRCAARVALRVLRQSGRATFSVLAIGEAAEVTEFIAQVGRDKSA